VIASTSDIVVADLVHQRIGRIATGDTSARSGTSRVYISSLWAALCADSDDRWFPRAPVGQRVAFGHSELADFQAWLTCIVRYTDASGRPLIVLGKASPDPGDHGDPDVVIDRVADPKAYAPRVRQAIVLNPSALRPRSP
jgi:hypothetical protein